MWRDDDTGLRQAHVLEGHQHGVISSSFSSDSSIVATSSIECSVRLWSTADGEQQLCIDAAPMDSWQVRLSPDANSQLLATGTAGGKVNLFNIQSGEKVASMESNGKFLLSLAFNTSGDRIFAASQEGIVYMFDVETQKHIRNFECHAMPIRCMKVMPDTQLLVTGSDDKYIKIHDMTESAQQVVCSLPGHGSWVLDCDASNRSKQIASASADCSVRVWDVGERAVLHCFKEHTDQVWGVAYNANASRLVSASEDKSIVVYSIPVA